MLLVSCPFVLHAQSPTFNDDETQSPGVLSTYRTASVEGKGLLLERNLS